MSINEVQLLGHLGADPEVRTTAGGASLVTFRLATSERWKDRGGQQQERTEWHSVVVFKEGLVDVCKRYLKKGSKLYLRGQLRTQKWQAQDGSDRYSTEVVLQGFEAKIELLDKREADAGRHDYGAHDDGRGRSGGAAQGGGAPIDDLDDDVPF